MELNNLSAEICRLGAYVRHDLVRPIAVVMFIRHLSEQDYQSGEEVTIEMQTVAIPDLVSAIVSAGIDIDRAFTLEVENAIERGLLNRTSIHGFLQEQVRRATREIRDKL